MKFLIKFILVLSYDNMCHLDTLNMFKKPLPAKGNLAYIWQKITKGKMNWIYLFVSFSSSNRPTSHPQSCGFLQSPLEPKTDP